MTRKDKIIAHFNDGLTISQMEATGLYRMPQLPTVIRLLKKDGWKIRTDMRKTRLGNSYARYTATHRPDGTEVVLKQDA